MSFDFTLVNRCKVSTSKCSFGKYSLSYVKYDKKWKTSYSWHTYFSCLITFYHYSVTIMQIVMFIMPVGIKALGIVILFVFIKIIQLCINFFQACFVWAFLPISPKILCLPNYNLKLEMCNL